jgi:Uma2 family endonuclease
MMQTAASAPAVQKITFEEYLLYEGEIDVRYELFEGQLEAMTPPTALHAAICDFLTAAFQRQIAQNNFPLVTKTNIGVRTSINSSRIPDVIVCSRLLLEGLTERGGAGIFNMGEVPLLIVEVVSEDWRQDYIRKRAEYALIASSEYWIVDPYKQRIWILTEPESENGYERAEFVRGQTIVSTVFPELALTVDEIFLPPPVEDLMRLDLQALEQESQRAEAEAQRAMQESQRADAEYQRAEQERQRAEQAEQELEMEREKAKRLADYLRQQGIDPELL